MRSSLCNFFSCCETQQLILGTGTAISWVTEPHYVIASDTHILMLSVIMLSVVIPIGTAPFNFLTLLFFHSSAEPVKVGCEADEECPLVTIL